MHAVLIADQRGSRTRPDGVPAALAALEHIPTVLAFERTAGDEIQGLLRCDESVIDSTLTLSRLGGWRIGIGLGTVDVPLPESTRAARGAAYLAARDAVEAARRAPGDVSVLAQPALIETVSSPPYDRSAGIEACLASLVWIQGHRSKEGWQVADAMDAGNTRQQIATRLGISASAVSQRLRRAGWAEQAQLTALATALLTTLNAGHP